jgi:hypothetical protein
MPTDPLHSVLYRELMIAQAQDVLSIATPLFQELVNYGSNALIRCATSSRGNENEDLAPLALYRHILEMTDAFEVLIANSCAAPTVPILRSTFEALLSLEYILESETEYVLRSLSWLAGYVRKRIAMYESMLPTTQRGMEFIASVRKDKSIPDLLNPPADDVEKAIGNLRILLNREQFADIQIEFDRLGSSVNWYNLFGGPPNIQQLAYHLNRHAQYDFLYRQWSSVAHAHDFSPFLAVSSTGESGIRGIRDPGPIVEVSRFAATFMIEATRLLLRKFRPGESFAEYYMKEIRTPFMQLISR